MTLEIKKYCNPELYNSDTPYDLQRVLCIFYAQGSHYKYDPGSGCVSITTTCAELFPVREFEYVKNKDTGEYYVKDGKWVRKDHKVYP